MGLAKEDMIDHEGDLGAASRAVDDSIFASDEAQKSQNNGAHSSLLAPFRIGQGTGRMIVVVEWVAVQSA